MEGVLPFALVPQQWRRPGYSQPRQPSLGYVSCLSPNALNSPNALREKREDAGQHPEGKSPKGDEHSAAVDTKAMFPPPGVRESITGNSICPVTGAGYPLPVDMAMKCIEEEVDKLTHEVQFKAITSTTHQAHKSGYIINPPHHFPAAEVGREGQQTLQDC